MSFTTPREVEEVVLTKIALGEGLTALVSKGVSPAWFIDPSCRRAFELQLKHHAENGKAATFQLYDTHSLGIQQRFAPEDSIETLVETLRVSTLSYLTKRAASRFLSEADVGEVPFEKAYSTLVTGVTAPLVSDLLGTANQGRSLQDAWDGFILEAEKRRQAMGVVGIPYPWATLNYATGGMSPGDYPVFMGYRKNGKSDLALEVGVHAAQDVGEIVLVISNEMSFEDIRNRAACRWAKVKYRDFRHGTFDENTRQKLATMVGEMKHFPRFQIEFVATTGLAAVNHVRALIDRYKPGVVIWDGHSLSAESQGWEDVYALSRATRRLALERHVPIIPTVQLNPKKAEASYKAYHQDATITVLVSKEGEWRHCETPDVREEDPVRWSVHLPERGLPALEQPYCATGTDAHKGNVAKESVLS